MNKFMGNLLISPSPSLTNQAILKALDWNRNGNYMSRWVISRGMTSFGVAGASLRDAIQEVGLALYHSIYLCRPSPRSTSFKFLRVPYLYTNHQGREHALKETCEHLRKTFVHITIAFTALSLGAIAPTKLFLPTIKKLGFAKDIELRDNLLSRIATLVHTHKGKIAVGLIAAAGTVRCFAAIPVSRINRSLNLIGAVSGAAAGFLGVVGIYHFTRSNQRTTSSQAAGNGAGLKKDDISTAKRPAEPEIHTPTLGEGQGVNDDPVKWTIAATQLSDKLDDNPKQNETGSSVTIVNEFMSGMNRYLTTAVASVTTGIQRATSSQESQEADFIAQLEANYQREQKWAGLEEDDIISFTDADGTKKENVIVVSTGFACIRFKDKHDSKDNWVRRICDLPTEPEIHTPTLGEWQVGAGVTGMINGEIVKGTIAATQWNDNPKQKETELSVTIVTDTGTRKVGRTTIKNPKFAPAVPMTSDQFEQIQEWFGDDSTKIVRITGIVDGKKINGFVEKMMSARKPAKMSSMERPWWRPGEQQGRPAERLVIYVVDIPTFTVSEQECAEAKRAMAANSAHYHRTEDGQEYISGSCEINQENLEITMRIPYMRCIDEIFDVTISRSVTGITFKVI